ncbi:MAG TPA: DUF2066 domain-containing protein [Gammaproteobacteria bacterium]
MLAAPLQASESLRLYQAEVKVSDKGAKERARGMQEAMTEVLVKVSGTRRVSEHGELGVAMSSAARYVQQYSYRNEQIGGREMTLLSVRFDTNGINELLRRHGFTIWGSARPSTLLWLGVEQGGRRQLVGANDGGAVRAYVEQGAARRGLPLKLPLLDLSDQSRVRPADVWGEFIDTIEEASARYAPHALLIGRLYQAGSNRWGARWTLNYQGETVRWQERSGNMDELIAAGIDRTAEHLLERFSSTLVGGSGNMLLEVQGVSSLKQYRQVADYLSGVHGVKAVRAEQVTHDAARFSLQTEGGSEAVLQLIGLGDVLEPAPRSVPVPLPQQRPAGAYGAANDAETANEAMAEQPPVASYRLVP